MPRRRSGPPIPERRAPGSVPNRGSCTRMRRPQRGTSGAGGGRIDRVGATPMIKALATRSSRSTLRESAVGPRRGRAGRCCLEPQTHGPPTGRRVRAVSSRCPPGRAGSARPKPFGSRSSWTASSPHDSQRTSCDVRRARARGRPDRSARRASRARARPAARTAGAAPRRSPRASRQGGATSR